MMKYNYIYGNVGHFIEYNKLKIPNSVYRLAIGNSFQLLQDDDDKKKVDEFGVHLLSNSYMTMRLSYGMQNTVCCDPQT